jgi:hypothetical protein
VANKQAKLPLTNDNYAQMQILQAQMKALWAKQHDVGLPYKLPFMPAEVYNAEASPLFVGLCCEAYSRQPPMHILHPASPIYPQLSANAWNQSHRGEHCMDGQCRIQTFGKSFPTFMAYADTVMQPRSCQLDSIISPSIRRKRSGPYHRSQTTSSAQLLQKLFDEDLQKLLDSLDMIGARRLNEAKYPNTYATQYAQRYGNYLDAVVPSLNASLKLPIAQREPPLVSASRNQADFAGQFSTWSTIILSIAIPANTSGRQP